jgi:hypothetical protein
MSVSGAAAPLPILTFNETSLSPSFGYVFDRRWLDPYESLVSMLWKFARMNRLAGHLVVGHIARLPVDPYEGIGATPNEVDIRGVAQTLRVTSKAVRAAMAHPDGQRRWCPVLRFCTRCMGRGYHGLVHQLHCESCCPVHGGPLLTECRGCGVSSAYRLDARLLDAPFKCMHCRRPYGKANFLQRRPLACRARAAITRTCLGVGAPPAVEAARRRR